MAERKKQLPKNLCFKGDNGKYLSARVIEGYNYLQFSSDDIGDQTIRHTIHTNPDGTVRIRSEYFGRFWRRSPNWIWADSADTGNGNKDTLFTVVMLGGDMVALQNHGNNNHCARLTTEGKDSCLNANSPSINLWARLKMEEPVILRRIYNVQYRTKEAKIYDKRTITMDTKEAVNKGNTEYKTTLTSTYSVTRTSNWNATTSMKLGVKTEFTAGVPEVASTTVTIESEFSASYSWGDSVSHAEQRSDSYELVVRPKTKRKLTVLATQATCDVPFSYTQEDTLTTGERVVTRFGDGMYRGMNNYDFQSTVTDEAV